MAINWQTFRTRTGSAILFAAIMLSGLLWNQWSFFILFSIIHFGCWIEYQRLVEKIDPGYKQRSTVHSIGVMLLGWCLLFLFAAGFFMIGDYTFHGIGCWGSIVILSLLVLNELFFLKNIRTKNFGHSIFGLIYISLSWGLMISLFNDFTSGQEVLDRRTIPIIIIAAIWINDTMAYIVGSLIGKTPLTSISPKKTWEGTLGGMILSVLVCGLLAWLVFDPGDFKIHVLFIAAISAIMGTFGDLLESKLKRLAGVKDSGTMLPGHGGFLDRFDSMLLAIPFVWLYVTFCIK